MIVNLWFGEQKQVISRALISPKLQGAEMAIVAESDKSNSMMNPSYVLRNTLKKFDNVLPAKEYEIYDNLISCFL